MHVHNIGIAYNDDKAELNIVISISTITKMKWFWQGKSLAYI